MHPRTTSDLLIESEPWNELLNGVLWLMEQFVGFSVLLFDKYVTDDAGGPVRLPALRERLERG
jgi:hypothetical protein